MKKYLVVAAATLLKAGAAQAAFVVTNLGYLPDTSAASAQALNDSGQVVGFMTGTVGGAQVLKAFSFAGGALTDLGVLSGGSGAQAFGVNNAGQVVGQSTVNGQTQAFVSAGGTMTGLGGLPGGNRSVAYDISDAGVIVGLSTSSSSSRESAVSYVGGNVVDLGVLPRGVGGAAFAVNASGVTVGYSIVRTGSVFNSTNYDRAFVGTQAALTGINTGTLSSYANDINDAGVVVGSASSPGFTFGYVMANGAVQRLTDLSPSGFDSSTRANAINEAGTIVGESDFFAFAYSLGRMVNLNRELVNGAGWTLNTATDINESGQIVGTGRYNGQQAGFLLTPVAAVPLPAAAWLMLSGLGVLGAVARRRKSRARA